jgi:hypothetical protein
MNGKRSIADVEAGLGDESFQYVVRQEAHLIRRQENAKSGHACGGLSGSDY